MVVHWGRDPGLFLVPGLPYEDGRDFFAFYYNHRQPGAVLRFYAGYVSLLPNALGWLLVGALPVTWVPRAFAATAGVLAALACALPALPSLAPVFGRSRWRLGVVAVLALAPVANHLFVSSLAYSIWSLLAILVWLTLLPAPRGWGGTAWRLPVMGLLLASHPVAVAMVPVWLIEGWRHRRRLPALVLYGGLVLLMAAYGALGIEHGGAAPPPSGEAAVEALSSPSGWLKAAPEVVHTTALFMVERVLFGSLAGDAALVDLHRRGLEGWVIALGALVGLLALAAAVRLRRRLGPAAIHALVVLAWMMVAVTGLWVVARSPGAELLEQGGAMRYVWVQRLLWLAILGILARAAWRSRQAGWRRRRRLPALGAVVVLLAVVSFCNTQNYRVPHRPGHALAAFLQGVAEQEAVGRGVDAHLPRRGPWSIHLERSPEPGG